MTVTAEDVKDAFRAITLYTSRQVNEHAAGPFIQAFAGKIDRTLFAAAMSEWLRTHGPSSPLPSVKDLELAVADARRIQHEREKKQTPTFNHAVAAAASAGVVLDEYTRAVIDLIPAVTSLPSWHDRAEKYHAFAKQWGRNVPHWIRCAVACLEMANPGRVVRPPLPQVIP